MPTPENVKKIDKLFKRYNTIAEKSVKIYGRPTYPDQPFLKDPDPPRRVFNEEQYWNEVDKLIHTITSERDKMVRNEEARKSFITEIMDIETYVRMPNRDLVMAAELAKQAAILLECSRRFYKESEHPDSYIVELIETGTKVTQATMKYLHHECQQGIVAKSDG